MAYKYNTLNDIRTRVKIVNGCWNWPTRRATGYGSVYLGGGRNNQISVMAHRLSFQLAKGPIPDGLVIDHLCRNPSCVNPDHLEPVTERVNLLRGNGAAARCAARDKCVNGHVFPLYQPPYCAARGWRRCRKCHAEREMARRLARKLEKAR